MGKRWFTPAAVLAVGLMLAAGFLLGIGSAAAQSDMATPAMGGMDESTAHPAHIHAGTCDTLGEVVYPLNDVAHGMATPMAGDMMGTPTTDMQSDTMGAAMASPMGGMDMANVVAQSTTTVQTSLSDLTSGQYAINVHESAENIQNYIACGNITGSASNDQLQVTLNELNGSGYQGEATLKDNGDGTTTVSVYLMHTGDMMATPVS